MQIWCSVSKARVQVLVIAVACFIYTLPRFFNETIKMNADGYPRRTRTAVGNSKFWYGIMYETVTYFLVIYVIPFPSLLAMTYYLVRSLKEANVKRQQMISGHTKKSREETDLTHTLVVVVVVFIICMTPNTLRRALSGLLPKSSLGCGHFYYYYHPISTTCNLINSAINFFIYFAFGNKFRRHFRKQMRRMFCLREKVHPDDSSSGGVSAVSALGNTNVTTKNTATEQISASVNG